MHRRELHPRTDGDARQVRDAMTRKVITVTDRTPVAEAARLMMEHRVGALPVVRDEILVGIVTDRDIARRLEGRRLAFDGAQVSDVMTPEVSFVARDASLAEAARTMRRLGVHRLAVVDGDWGLVGILSVDDLPKDLR